MGGRKNKQATEQSNNNNHLPAFVKQLLLFVLPTKQKDIIHDSNNTTSSDSTSPFEEMYFSFPALEEDLDVSKNTTCGQHHQAHHRHERSNVVKSTNNSGILC